MNVYRYETLIDVINFQIPTIFLAGPTVRGHQTHLKSWRLEAIEILKSKGFDGNVIVPEFSVSTISDKYRYDLPQWEFEGLRRCDVIMFWIPRSKELLGLTSNYELGYWTARERAKIVYGRPDDAYRMNYCDIMWCEDGKVFEENSDYSFPIYNTLEKTVDAAMEKIKKLNKQPRYFSKIDAQRLATIICNSFKKVKESYYEDWLVTNKSHNDYDAILNSNGYEIPWIRLSDKMEQDLSRVNFDTENIACAGDYYGQDGIVGFQTLPNGMTYLGIVAGGDWETPIFFIVYYDGTNIRAYIPKEGNLWNTDINRAYGNDEDSDIKNAEKRFGAESLVQDLYSLKPNADLIRKDIMDAIKPLEN